jgi:hypothetical protein
LTLAFGQTLRGSMELSRRKAVVPEDFWSRAGADGGSIILSGKHIKNHGKSQVFMGKCHFQ